MNFRYLLLSLLLAALIVFLSSMPDQSFPRDVLVIKQIIYNLAHVPAYGLLAFLWLKSFPETKPGKKHFTVTLLMVAGLVLFAISDEIHQSFVPGRTSSYADIGLDVIGISLGFAASKLNLRCFSSRLSGKR
ncbi:MAG: VanZ family protein [Deltaproteobacteria bacterium]|jgi:VanZ family protein|nr:VanZ family protein [Deltaproteobacteria bacterium]